MSKEQQELLDEAYQNYVNKTKFPGGDTAPPFEFKTFAQDLEECQRYYYRLTTVNSDQSY